MTSFPMASHRPPRKPDAQHGELADRTYRQLRELIVRGRLPPGARAMETELAKRFGVSRTPVRESLARLAQEGYLVSATAGRRIERIVAPLAPESVDELWTVIGGLEGLALQGVVALGREARRQLAAELARINDELSAAATARRRNNDHISELMTVFHVCFMDECAGPTLRALYDIVRPHVRRYEWAYGMRREARYDASIREHGGIIDAVAAGDGARARALVERHWANGAKRTRAMIAR